MISWLNLLGISLGLAMDAFAVSIAAGLGLARVTPRHTFRVAFPLRLVPVLDACDRLVGRPAVEPIHSSIRPLVALGLLTFCRLQNAVGGRDPTRTKFQRRSYPGPDALTLSLATSIDALAVGVSMALLGVSIWLPSVVIGLITATLSAVGITFGGTLGSKWQRWAEIAGGAVLILIGLEIFISH